MQLTQRCNACNAAWLPFTVLHASSLNGKSYEICKSSHCVICTYKCNLHFIDLSRNVAQTERGRAQEGKRYADTVRTGTICGDGTVGLRSVDHKSKRYAAAHSPNVASCEMLPLLLSLPQPKPQPQSLPASSRVAAINFHTQTTQLAACSLCRLPLAGCNATAAAAAAANKLRIDLRDLWHSSKINLNKRCVLVSTLSSLSYTSSTSVSFLSSPPLEKCKFYMKIKEYKKAKVVEAKGRRHAACGKWQATLLAASQVF